MSAIAMSASLMGRLKRRMLSSVFEMDELSLYLIVRTFLAVPIAGSIPLFMLGIVIYLFFACAIGIFIATIARSMPQLGLLFMLIFLPMNMLSGSNTPLESMPHWLATAMDASPSTHFVSLAQSILYRGAGFGVILAAVSNRGCYRCAVFGRSAASVPRDFGANCLTLRIIEAPKGIGTTVVAVNVDYKSEQTDVRYHALTWVAVSPRANAALRSLSGSSKWEDANGEIFPS